MPRFWPPLMLSSLAVLLVAGLLLAPRLRFNLSASMPVGLYWLANSVVPVKSDLVTTCLEGSWASLARERGYLAAGTCPDGQQPLLKEVMAMGGDVLIVEERGISVNGHLLTSSTVRAADTKGRPLSSSLVAGSVPPGYALVMGRTPESFDGRYVGLLPVENLQRVDSLFTFNK